MVIIVNKETEKKDIKIALNKVKKKAKKPKLSDFYGKLKGVFGDGLKYQKKLRNEWD